MHVLSLREMSHPSLLYSFYLMIVYNKKSKQTNLKALHYDGVQQYQFLQNRTT